jgi:calcineurin-like phosphoesterase family protein
MKKLTTQSKTKTWFTSDTHFDDSSIVGRTDRNYTSVAAMNDHIAQLWNSCVQQGDTVYHLGDFASCNVDRTNALLKRLNGKKILIRGNHDKVNGVTGWHAMYDSLRITVDDIPVFLTHYPMREWPKQWRGVIHLYGHVHGNISPCDGSMDVGFDVWNRLVQMSDIMQHIKLFNVEEEHTKRVLFRLRDGDQAS